MLVTGAASTDVGVRMNIVNIAGNVALLHVAKIVQRSPDVETAKLTPILHFLLEAATRDVDLRVVAEALDKIIDIFSEDETDPLCVEVFSLLIRKITFKKLLDHLKISISRN